MTLILQLCDNFYVISLQVLTKKKQNTRRVYQDSEPCVNQAYSELWYIQNSGIFKTRGIFGTLVYPKLWLIQNQRHIQNSW